MEKRNTIQRNLVLKAVQTLRRHVTADEVYESVREEYPSIGKGTVYRNLALLAEEGKILRVEIPDGPDRFDFTLKKHYHVRCVKCADVYDVDMDTIPQLENGIRDTHGMLFLEHDILFKGICPQCQYKNGG